MLEAVHGYHSQADHTFEAKFNVKEEMLRSLQQRQRMKPLGKNMTMRVK